MSYSFNRYRRLRKLTLGCDYNVNGKICRLIKVTPKGFNFLDLHTSRCIAKQHMYANGFIGTDRFIPKAQTTFDIFVHNWMWISKPKQEEQA